MRGERAGVNYIYREGNEGMDGGIYMYPLKNMVVHDSTVSMKFQATTWPKGTVELGLRRNNNIIGKYIMLEGHAIGQKRYLFKY